MDESVDLIKILYKDNIDRITSAFNVRANGIRLTTDFYQSLHNEMCSVLSPFLKQALVLEKCYIARVKGRDNCNDVFNMLTTDKDYHDLFFTKYHFLNDFFERKFKEFENFLFFLFDCIANDFIELKCRFGINTLNIGAITFLGDSHFGNQRTLKIDIDNITLIFKPRSVVAEDFLNKIVGLTELDAYTVLSKGSYGWCRYIEHKVPCMDEECHYNLGVLQAISFVTMTKDMHKENIVFDGSQPYIIDGECIMSCSVDISQRSFYPSNNVNDYGMLPFYWKETDKNIRSSSVLGVFYNQKKFSVKEMNSFRKAFISGFSNSSSTLIKNLELIKLQLSNYATSLRSRIVLRNTAYYASLLKLAFHPVYLMKPKADLELELKRRLYREGIQSDVIDYECQTLLNGDIPYFYCNVEGNSIFAGGHKKIVMSTKNNLKEIFASTLNRHSLMQQINRQVNIINLYFDVECFNRKGINNETE